jgi:putative Holliday junction resolvase
MRVLALDLGTRRIGLAVSDSDGSVAFPAGCLEREGTKRDLAVLRSLVRERGIECIVVGLPVHMSGRLGVEAEAAERFAQQLARETGLPVDTLDERWTTRQAERALRDAQASKRRRRQRGRVDSVAAALLLQTYLERRRAAPPNGEGR